MLVILDNGKEVARYCKERKVFIANDGCETLVPVTMFRRRKEASYEDFHTWMIKRVPPPNRLDLDVVLKRLGLTEYDPFLMAVMANARNVCDNYTIHAEEGEYIEDIDEVREFLAKADKQL